MFKILLFCWNRCTTWIKWIVFRTRKYFSETFWQYLLDFRSTLWKDLFHFYGGMVFPYQSLSYFRHRVLLRSSPWYLGDNTCRNSGFRKGPAWCYEVVQIQIFQVQNIWVTLQNFFVFNRKNILKAGISCMLRRGGDLIIWINTLKEVTLQMMQTSW